MNVYIGNLAHQVTEEDIRQAFEAFGKIETINIIKDKMSGEPRGFGFVEMPSQEEAQAAIQGLNGKDLLGRPLTVSQARPRGDDRRGGGPGQGGRPGGFGGGRGGGGFGGGGGRRNW